MDSRDEPSLREPGNDHRQEPTRDQIDEIAYLVEAADPRYPSSVLPGHFLGFTGQTGMNASGGFAWMSSVQWAIRFSRRQDAEMFIGAMLRIAEDQPFYKTLPGLTSRDPRPHVVEHSWSI